MSCPECVPVVLIDPAYDQPVCDFAGFGYPWCPRCLEHHRVWPDCPGLTAEDIADAERAQHAQGVADRIAAAAAARDAPVPPRR